MKFRKNFCFLITFQPELLKVLSFIRIHLKNLKFQRFHFEISRFFDQTRLETFGGLFFCQDRPVCVYFCQERLWKGCACSLCCWYWSFGTFECNKWWIRNFLVNWRAKLNLETNLCVLGPKIFWLIFASYRLNTWYLTKKYFLKKIHLLVTNKEGSPYTGKAKFSNDQKT